MQVRQALLRVGEAVRDCALAEIRSQSAEALSAVAFETAADKIYVIDRSVERVLLPALENHLAPLLSFALICEGVNDERPLAFPAGRRIDDCEARLLIDPIDGTRPIMYNKRSAWWLAGLAPNRGEATSLRDIELAVQVEIPTTRAFLGDNLWATRGGGAGAETVNLLTGERQPASLQPSRAASIRGGFASFFHPFPGGKQVFASIEEELVGKLIGGLETTTTPIFDEQYLSTGGQLYELIAGRDRLLADLRGLLFERYRREGLPAGHACHPYDICTALIAEESGIEITDGRGNPLDAPFDTISDVSWIGYANRAIRDEVEPVLLRLLEKFSLC